MSKIITEPTGDLQSRMHSSANKLAGYSRSEVLALMRDGAKVIAEQLVAADIPIQSRRFRPDVGSVQIDMAVIEGKVSRPEPAMQLQFEVEGGLGITLNIKLMEFVADPAGYVKDLFSHLGPMRRNVLKMRTNRRESNSRLYEAMTKGAANV